MSNVHVISQKQLKGYKQSGQKIRAYCPIHNSRDLDLALNPPAPDARPDEDEARLAGYGYCHSINCQATVLVQEWNPSEAARLLGRFVQFDSPDVTVSVKELEKAKEWQELELKALTKIEVDARQHLTTHARSLAYLEQRGLASERALALLASLEVGYIPPLEEWSKPCPDVLKNWCDRLIFPVTRSDKRGYTGRALALWRSGMDEGEHKKLLDKHSQIKRWLKTYIAGMFNAAILSEHRHVHVCEGAFDVLPLLLEGLPAIAVCGAQVRSILDDLKGVKRLYELTIAFDADVEGQERTEKMLDLLRGAGFETHISLPPHAHDNLGKDWSERYRLHGREGLASLFSGGQGSAPAPALSAQEDEQELASFLAACQEADYYLCASCLDEGKETRVPSERAQELTYEDMIYCEAHHPIRRRVPPPELLVRLASALPPGATCERIDDLAAFKARVLATRRQELKPERQALLAEYERLQDASAPGAEQQENFWERVKREGAIPPRYHVPELGANGLPIRGKPTPIYDDEHNKIGETPGNIKFTLGSYMMSRQEWSRRRAQELAWRPNPELYAHNKHMRDLMARAR